MSALASIAGSDGLLFLKSHQHPVLPSGEQPTNAHAEQVEHIRLKRGTQSAFDLSFVHDLASDMLQSSLRFGLAEY